MRFAVASCAGVLALSGSAFGQVVFQNIQDNGFFTPFNSSTPSSVRYGDSGWFGSGSDAPVALNSITLGMAVFGGNSTGLTDLTFTFNDGDPSGLIFGTGAQLYSVTVSNVFLPASIAGPAFFNVTIPLPGVSTTGGYNNVGWSVGVSNFSYSGSMGFQCSSGFGQTVGFYTNLASSYNGSSWSLFDFSPNPFPNQYANFVATITTPAPGAAGLLGLAGLVAMRRRR